MMDENQKIQKITNLLEKGGTMLANHHECGAPMFRYQGKILCPVCDYQKIDKEKQKSKKVVKLPADETETDVEIGDLIKNKLHSIASDLENETDLQRVKDKMECIEIGIRILKLLRE